jgi:prepilin-type N-terminal cleavage/methylation domain-containing protein
MVDFRPVCRPPAARNAFTIVEILVVIAIMVILAGLIVGLAGPVQDKKVITRTQAQINQLVTLIDTYKARTGVYPPGNPNNFNTPTNTSLFYELAGAVVLPGGDFQTKFATVTPAALTTACGVGGLINSASGNPEDMAGILRLLPKIAPDETNTIAVGGSSVVVFVAASEGPNGRKINPIYYRVGTNGAHNPTTYDIWAEVKVRSGARIIGNWKN